MTVTAGKHLSRLVRDLGNAIVDRFEGKADPRDYEKELTQQLAKYDLNSEIYRADIARAYVKADIAERAKVNPFIEDEDGHLAPERFSEKTFARGIIRLGRYVVKMSDATSQNWIARQLHQQQAAQAAQDAATRTTEFLQTPPGVLLMENPRMQTRAAMHQLELWPNDAEDVPEQDDEGDE